MLHLIKLSDKKIKNDVKGYGNCFTCAMYCGGSDCGGECSGSCRGRCTVRCTENCGNQTEHELQRFDNKLFKD